MTDKIAEMSSEQKRKKEEIVKGMKKNFSDLRKKYGSEAETVMHATATKKAMGEETQDQHMCAKHVYSDIFGEGTVLEAEHAEPDENGNIEWYTVQFNHGKETVFTDDIKVMHEMMHGNHKKKKKMTEGPVDQSHYCATHVEHSILGPGECISEQHAEPDENGNIAWYTVKFESGIQRMFTENLNIVKAESHMLSKKKTKTE